MTPHKIAIKFAKTGLLRYISHLDLMRLFSRTLRKAEIPAALTQGYNPHLKISFDRALKLGVESRDEKAVFWLNVFLDPSEFKRRMNRELPEGVQILEAYLEDREKCAAS